MFLIRMHIPTLIPHVGRSVGVGYKWSLKPTGKANKRLQFSLKWVVQKNKKIQPNNAL